MDNSSSGILLQSGGQVTMSSREIAELTGKDHKNVIRDIRELFTALKIEPSEFSATYRDVTGRGLPLFNLPKRECLVLVSGYSVALRAKIIDRWMELEAGVQVRPLTTTETLIQMLQLQAAVERRQEEQGRAIASLEDKVALVEATQLLSSRPANSESITHIRQRIGSKFGLSSDIIDFVLRQSPYAPKPAGNVRNDHSSADGATYTVWWQRDVTAVFNRFLNECKPVTQFMHTHPFIDGRFRVARKEVVA
ncbi:Rha family transcriptional regulator [Agrobacterium sp. S2/73]|uniref:Rha family transcriptional regulator n=1 Tax=unclassified Agrobacterium TaxID=2632611 RepID=UPI001ADC146A|nr:MULTISPECIES: Rha family transcriptional regulator [unclassified Agrobacterium]MBO9108727.1 Rha family transcriptional regulator [Agrobacterium sp. S2/73]QXZ73514.1 Rha family transcriptional regulator [Agrobacterium sp. S7/73]